MRKLFLYAGVLKNDIKEFFAYNNNRLYAAFVIMFLIFYQSLQFFIEHPSWYVTFSPELTIWIQKHLSTPSMDMVLSLYYPIGFILCLILLQYLMIKQGKDGWKWGIAVVACWIAHFGLEMIFPVAPPLRWESGARAIRLEALPMSDILVSVKYGGMPSGHFGYVFLGFLIARYNYIKTRLSSYNKYMWFLLINLILTTFTVLYLGEHTWEDLAGSVIVFGGIYWIVSRYVSIDKADVEKSQRRENTQASRA